MSHSANKNDLKSATFAIVLALIDLAVIVFLTLVVISHLLVGHTTVLFVLFIIFPLLTFFALMIIFARELIAGDDMTTYGSFDDERTDYDYLQDGREMEEDYEWYRPLQPKRNFIFFQKS